MNTPPPPEVKVTEADRNVAWAVAYKLCFPRVAHDDQYRHEAAQLVAAHRQQAVAAETAEIESLRMQLAACMTASVQNTERSIKDRITRESPYWSQAYADVCAAVDREMALRAKLAVAEKDSKRLDFLISEGSMAKFSRECLRLDWDKTPWPEGARRAIDACLLSASPAEKEGM